MKITTIRIPEELDRDLTEYANKEELSKNQVRMWLKREKLVWEILIDR